MKIHINLITSKKRKAIAMVELIFAIVVIGITLLSVPLMVNQATQSTYTTLQQEGISAAASNMSLILSREWDEADTNASLGAPILTTSNGTYNPRPNLRSRTYFTSVGGTLSATSIGHEGGDSDDVDDADGATTLVDDTDGDDLIDQDMTISTVVSYRNGTTSDIKDIAITLTTGGVAELNKTIVLNAFSSNIGSYKLERKVFP